MRMRWQTKKKENRYTGIGSENIGKIICCFGEYGVVIETPKEFVSNLDEICVRWDTKIENDYEGYLGMVAEIVENYELKYINIDGTLKK